MSSPGSDASVGRRNPMRAAAGATPWRVMTGVRRLDAMSRAPRKELSEAERVEVDGYLSRLSKKKAHAPEAVDRSDKSGIIANKTWSPNIFDDANFADAQAVGIQEIDGRGNNRALPNTSTPTRSQGLRDKTLSEDREGEDWNMRLGGPITASTPASPLANHARAKPSEGHQLKNPRPLPPLSLRNQSHKLTNNSDSTPVRPLSFNDQLGTLSYNSDLSGRLPASEGRLWKPTDKINYPPIRPLSFHDQLGRRENRSDRLTGRIAAPEGQLLTLLDQADPLYGRLLPPEDQLLTSDKPESGELAEQAHDSQEIPPQGGDIPVLVVDPESVLFYGGFIAFLWMSWLIWSM